jgi:hypothetical protein
MRSGSYFYILISELNYQHKPAAILSMTNDIFSKRSISGGINSAKSRVNWVNHDNYYGLY